MSLISYSISKTLDLPNCIYAHVLFSRLDFEGSCALAFGILVVECHP